MRLPAWLTPYRRQVFLWLILRDRDIPRTHARTASVRRLIRKRLARRIDEDYVLTDFGAKIFAEVQARMR